MYWPLFSSRRFRLRLTETKICFSCAFMETQDNVTYNPWCEQEERDTNHEVPHRSRDGEYFIEDEEADWSVQGEEDDSE